MQHHDNIKTTRNGLGLVCEVKKGGGAYCNASGERRPLAFSASYPSFLYFSGLELFKLLSQIAYILLNLLPTRTPESRRACDSKRRTPPGNGTFTRSPRDPPAIALQHARSSDNRVRGEGSSCG